MINLISDQSHVLSLTQKDLINKAGMICLVLALLLLFFDWSASLTLGVLGAEGMIQRRLHGKRVEEPAVACFIGGFLLVVALMFIGPWNAIGGVILIICGAVLWSIGY